MKFDHRRLAWLGFALSGLAIFSIIALLIVKGLASAGIYQPPDELALNRSPWMLAAIAILGFALTAFLDPERIRSLIFGRQVKNGSNAVLMLVAFVGILFFLNLLAYQNPKSWDVTQNQANTLAPETVSILKSLPQPVTVHAYYSSRVDPTSARKLLENFAQQSAGKLIYKFIDPDSNPVSAQQDGVDRDATIVLLMAGQKEPVNTVGEKELDVGLVRLIKPENQVIYFLTGHGEADIEGSTDSSYSMVKTALENKNYTVKSLNLGNESKVPADTRALIIPGPQTPVSDSEAILVKSYLESGGSVIVMENPRSLTKLGEAPDPLASLLSSWGITLQNDLLYDPNANPPLLVYADPLNYGQHPITENLRGMNSRFYTAQSLGLASSPTGITLTTLAQTYKEAWGETDFLSVENNQVSFDAARDHSGPLILAAAAENQSNHGRLVVFGDSEFAANGLYKLGNGDIFLNAVDWATRQEQLINLTPKSQISRTFNPPGSLGLIGIILVSVCIIPLAIFFGGVFTWYSRRKRG